MNIALVTAIWGRPALTEQFLRYYDETWDGLKVAVISNIQDRAVVRDSSWHWTIYPNQPLSDKWNKVFKYIRTWWNDIDGVVVVGSDDFMSPEYIAEIRYAAECGYEWIGPSTITFYDLPTGRMMWKRVARIGAGRFISRRVLDSCRWLPHKSGRETGIDGAMEDQLTALGWQQSKLHINSPIIDVKTLDNIWSFDKFMLNTHTNKGIASLSAGFNDPEEIWRGHYQPWLADWMLNREFVDPPEPEPLPEVVQKIRENILAGKKWSQ